MVCSAGKIGRKYITADPCCPTSCANDPTAAENTKHIEPNCIFAENDKVHFDEADRVFLKCIRDIPDASQENPVTLWVLYMDIEHVYPKKPKKNTAKAKVISPAKPTGSSDR